MSFVICVDIAARPERVWEVMIDIERWPDWTPSMKRIRRLDKGPLALGSRAFVRQPNVLPAVWKVTSLEPNRTFTWTTSIPGLLSVVAIHSIEAIEQCSQVTLALNFGRVLGRMIAGVTKEQNTRYLAFEAQGLKRRSENSL